MSEHDEGDTNIEMLLSNSSARAIAEAIDAHYMIYAPMVRANETSNCLGQLLMVLFEFTLGFPKKMWNCFLGAWHSLQTAFNHHILWVAIAFWLAWPIALAAYLKSFWVAIWSSVVTRTLIFKRKSVILRDIFGE